MIQCDILIVGGGLTGLALKYFLKDTPFSSILLEGRDRLGGRIKTMPSGSDNPPVEMGATWLGAKHTDLMALLKSLGIDVFPQKLGEAAIYEPISTSPFQLVTLPGDDQPSYRIKGGTASLIEALYARVPHDEIYTGCCIQRIDEKPTGLSVRCPGKVFEAKLVVSTLPPYLLHKTVSINPPLPESLTELMEQTHTWMGDSIKFGLVFDKPFWRDQKTSGTVFSNVGPVTEMYDHTDFEDDRYALKGFINGNFYTLSEAERRSRVLSQLRKYYGPIVDSNLAYYEKVWAYETFTYSEYEKPVFPHQNNGHSQYRKSWMNGKLLIAGSETAAEFPGYMEGAVRSAGWARDYILMASE